MDQEHTTSVSRRTVRLALASAVVMAVLAPAAVFAVGRTFVDDDTSIFEEDIEWLVANGVTAGCGTDTYCPEDNVTRGQMAAFMRRLATNKVVDAATAVTAANAETADSATTAGDSATLGGMTPDELTVNKPIGTGFYTRFGALAASGVTGVNSPEAGVYCAAIDPALGITPDEILVQVSIEWGTSSGWDLFAYWNEQGGSCEVDEFEIRTYQFAYDGGASVVDVELNSSVSWTFTMYHRPGPIAPAAAIDADTPTNATN